MMPLSISKNKLMVMELYIVVKQINKLRKNMATVFKHGPMVPTMKETGKMVCSLAKENTLTRMVMFMKATG